MTPAYPELFQSGILDEDSTIRAHVGVLSRCVYVFQTQAARSVLLAKGHLYPPRPASQDGFNGVTGLGHPIPWKEIPGIRRLIYDSYEWARFQPSMTTTQEGKEAVTCICQLMRDGKFPSWIKADTEESADGQIQIKGTDMIVWHKVKVQVKCDWRAGDGLGCSGNLYLQIAERNPLRRH